MHRWRRRGTLTVCDLVCGYTRLLLCRATTRVEEIAFRLVGVLPRVLTHPLHKCERRELEVEETDNHEAASRCGAACTGVRLGNSGRGRVRIKNG